MAKDSYSRKWQITINNPLEHGFTHERICHELDDLKSTVYYCMADEVGSTHHTHIYVCFSSVVRFSTMKNKFPQAHLEIVRGTSEQNRDYIMKASKWENDTKHGTSIPGSFCEFGVLPLERPGTRNDLVDLYDMVKSGMTNYEILEIAPEYLIHLDKLDRIRLALKAEEYREVFRDMEVTYIWGPTGVGKTRYVTEQHGYRNLYRVTNYQHPFDTYQNEPVLVFDEFRSQIKISDMLNYLDGHPLQLPCRYVNRQACYTKVYIISNMMLEQQYAEIKLEHWSTWMAFRRRINKVQYFPHQDENKFLQAGTKEELDKLMHKGG